MQMQFEIRAFISKSALDGPINAVKNIILDWAVDLEKAGVIGEGLGFTTKDKIEAANVTQNVYAQNIGNLGDLHDKSSVTNNLWNNKFSVEQVEKHLIKIQDAIPALPPEIRKPVEVEIKNAKAAAKTAEIESVQNALGSIRTICEGAAGNIAAEAIVALIKSLF